MTTFSVWLRSQTSRTDTIGELARQTRKEKFLPRNAQRLIVYLTYFQHQPQWRKAVKLAHAEWRRLCIQERRTKREGANQ